MKHIELAKKVQIYVTEGYKLTLPIFFKRGGNCIMRKTSERKEKSAPIVSIIFPDKLSGYDNLFQATRQLRRPSCRLFLTCCDLAGYLNRDAFICEECIIANRFDKGNIISGYSNERIIQAMLGGLKYALKHSSWGQTGYEIRCIKGGAEGSKPINMSIKEIISKERLVTSDYVRVVGGDKLSCDKKQSNLYFDIAARLQSGGKLAIFRLEKGILFPISDYGSGNLNNSNGHYQLLEHAVDKLFLASKATPSKSDFCRLISIGGHLMNREIPRSNYEKLCMILPGVNIAYESDIKPEKNQVIAKEERSVGIEEVIDEKKIREILEVLVTKYDKQQRLVMSQGDNELLNKLGKKPGHVIFLGSSTIPFVFRGLCNVFAIFVAADLSEQLKGLHKVELNRFTNEDAKEYQALSLSQFRDLQGEVKELIKTKMGDSEQTHEKREGHASKKTNPIIEEELLNIRNFFVKLDTAIAEKRKKAWYLQYAIIFNDVRYDLHEKMRICTARKIANVFSSFHDQEEVFLYCVKKHMIREISKTEQSPGCIKAIKMYKKHLQRLDSVVSGAIKSPPDVGDEKSTDNKTRTIELDGAALATIADVIGALIKDLTKVLKSGGDCLVTITVAKKQ